MDENSLLNLITKEKAAQAFEKAKAATHFDKGELIMIEENNFDKALDFLQNSFTQSEPISQAVNIGWNSEIQEMCVSTLKHNLSFMLINRENEEVMGLRMMQIMKHDDKIDPDQFEDAGMKKLIAFWKNTEEKVNFFVQFNVKEVIHFFGLGVHENYRRRGIGTKLMEVSLNLVKSLEIFPICIKGEASSNFSKKIYGKFKLPLVAEFPFEDYKENGEIIISNTGEHKSMKLYGKILTHMND